MEPLPGSAPGALLEQDGWVSTRADDDTEVHVRVRLRPDGRLVITGVLVEAAEVTTETLRRLQLARVLAALRPQRGRDMTMGDAEGKVSLSVPVYVDASALLEHYATADDTNTTLGDLRSRAIYSLRAATREPLGRPADYAALGRPDDFYKNLAAAYRSAATESSKPAVILAAENGVPVETVRRWIKEARRRRHLEPGRKGRAGR